MIRSLKLAAGLAFVMAVVAAPAAQARVFVRVGVGVPVYAPPPVYYYPPPPVYYPPPAYYPPVVYAPPPVVVAPAPVVVPAAAPPQQTGYCREYRGDATIDGKNQPFYGTACLRPDGKWHIVN